MTCRQRFHLDMMSIFGVNRLDHSRKGVPKRRPNKALKLTRIGAGGYPQRSVWSLGGEAAQYRPRRVSKPDVERRLLKCAGP